MTVDCEAAMELSDPTPSTRIMDKLSPDELESIPKQMETFCSKTVSADHLENIYQKFLDVLENAVWVRVRNAPLLPADHASELGLDVEEEARASTSGLVQGRARVALLFSGGVDSAVMAALVDR